MNKYFFHAATVTGAAVLAWIAVGFIQGAHLLALMVTLVIAVVYAIGLRELRHYQAATTTLTAALASIPAPLADLEVWLREIHPSLRNAVRLRTEGERGALPGPTLTPYLVGLLVMLGMLGTFLGMVVTLNGAVFALEGTNDLASMRAAFAAPIKGLGLAFGTSVAGVASSAMLGLMSTWSRRERLQAAQQLDAAISTSLRPFTLAHQRQRAYQALHEQSQALPLFVGQLQTLVAQMDRLGQQLHDRLLQNQDNFHSHIQSVYTQLATSIDTSLRESLVKSAQAAGESLQPVVQAAMAGMAHEARQLQAQLADTTQQQLAGLSTRLLDHAAAAQDRYAETDQQRLQAWTSALESVAAQSQVSTQTTLDQIGALLGRTEALVDARVHSEAAWTQQSQAHMTRLASLLQSELGALREQESQRSDAAIARLADLQAAVTGHLSTLGRALEEPITRLIQTASEAPRAAAEVIGQLRQEMTHSTARDNALLEERSRILETLNALLASIRHASVEQREVIDALVASSAVALQKAGSDFSNTLGQETALLSDVVARVQGSAVEVSSLSDAFGSAVRGFAQANEKLIDNLQRMEGAMDKSMLRSDEQLAFYIAQAREIVDLSIHAQKQVFDELRHLPRALAQSAPEVS